MRKTQHRNAMIKAEVRHWSDPNELASAVQKVLAPNKQSFESKLESIAVILAAFLKEKECPHPTEFCLFSGAYWCELPIGWEQMSDAEMRLAMKNATVGRGVAYIKQNFKLTDPESIAADICLRIYGYPRLSAEQRPEAAFHIGRLCQMLSGLAHLEIVERGKKNKEGNSRGGNETVKTQGHVEQRRRVVAAMEPRINGPKDVSSAAKYAADMGIGSSKGANRSIWYRYPELRSKKNRRILLQQ